MAVGYYVTFSSLVFQHSGLAQDLNLAHQLPLLPQETGAYPLYLPTSLFFIVISASTPRAWITLKFIRGLVCSRIDHTVVGPLHREPPQAPLPAEPSFFAMVSTSEDRIELLKAFQ